MNKRQAIIIYNIMTMYMEQDGEENFNNKYGSEGQFLIDEIGLTNEELDEYTKIMKELTGEKMKATSKEYTYDEIWEYFKQLGDEEFDRRYKQAKEQEDYDDLDFWFDDYMWNYFDVINEEDRMLGYVDITYKLIKGEKYEVK